MKKTKSRRKPILILGLAFFIAGTIGGTYAYYSDSITVENRIQLGDIDISLEEYCLDENQKEQVYDQNIQVLPGDTVSKIPRITCLTEPCYIRALITHSSPVINNTVTDDIITEDTTTEGTTTRNATTEDTTTEDTISCDSSQIQADEYPDILTDENIFGLSESWIKIGDYYYYKNILNPKESADLFQGVFIPYEWDNEHAEQKLNLNIQIDAVQAEHFTPDFSSDQPWGNEEIEVCAHSGDRSALVNPYTTMYVEFEGNSHKLVAVPKDFFSNLGQAMPGDLLNDTVTLKNTTEDEVELLFHTALPETLTEEQKSLLTKIELAIFLDGDKLYEGNLEAASLSSDISLGKYQSQENKEFTFSLTVPAELKNQYALADTVVRWVFSVQQDGKATPVGTGDTMMFLPFLFLGGGGLLLLGIYFILIIRQKRKNPKGKTHVI
ncbi:MAG: SipW-dependent-type signal peptide-containing protein [Lachnospiraceae bacterium]|nr:SipW-dependent-type signal peptide-containing protein [Lachnospiraceae bacterium]